MVAQEEIAGPADLLRGRAVTARRLDRDQRSGIGHGRQRAQQESVHRAEHGGDGAAAEREDEHDDHGEERRLTQRAAGEPEILEPGGDPLLPAVVADALAHQRGRADLGQRGAAGGGGMSPRTNTQPCRASPRRRVARSRSWGSVAGSGSPVLLADDLRRQLVRRATGQRGEHVVTERHEAFLDLRVTLRPVGLRESPDGLESPAVVRQPVRLGQQVWNRHLEVRRGVAHRSPRSLNGLPPPGP